MLVIISERSLLSDTLLSHHRLTNAEIYLKLSAEDAIGEFLGKW